MSDDNDSDATDADPKAGVCYLVGAGPGDPGLITVRGRECIERSDVIVYDYLANSELLRWAREDAELIYVGKRSTEHSVEQDSINDMLIEKAKQGKIVTRLKGGDPVIFGRGGEEARQLQAAGVRFELVPGISSATAGPVYAGIPLTHRECSSQLTIFTGHEDPGKAESAVDYELMAKTPGTQVMLMGVDRLRAICEALVGHGADPKKPVALVRWATTGQQRTLTGTLTDIADLVEKEKFEAPAVAVFGEVVNLREQLNWFETRPLFGRRIVVTRARKQAGKLSRQLLELGADVLEMPTIRIEPPEDLLGFGELVQDCHTYDWIIFTSPNGVERFFEMFYRLFKDARSIGGARIAAVGPGTAAKLKEYHMAVDLMPDNPVAENLAAAFETEIGSIDNLTMLWVRAEAARDELSQRLNKAGVILDEAIAYRTVPESADRSEEIEDFSQNGADILTFVSSSAVENFVALNLALSKDLKIASIGPITSKTLRSHGLDVDIEAKVSTIPDLVEAICVWSDAEGK
jgi:uroporphyrinogen III methyltransferase/synthase